MSRTDPPGSGKPFVLAISGIPGSGKTTLSRELSRRLKARVVYYDRHQPMTSLSMEQARAWFDRGADPNEIDHSGIVGDLARETRPEAGNDPLLLFETPFGRLHRASGAYVDYLVWIDTPLDLALSRAFLAFTQAARERPNPGFLDWQMRYLLNYPLVREMYFTQIARIRPDVDLTLDGVRPTEALADAVEAALKAQPAVAARIGFSSGSS